VPGLEHDALLAMRLRADAPNFEKPWTRVLFAWHYAMPMDTRLMLGAAGWAALWAALLLWRLTHGGRASPRAVHGASPRAGAAYGGDGSRGRSPSMSFFHAAVEIFTGVACVAGVAMVLMFGASGVASVASEWACHGRSPLEWLAPELEDAP